ncbi:DNA-3-methyladenine glycosylase [Candidatus Parcubacteria bacterium]|nr:MAG: DNA-3-methyladenine glycosylase [Candidatus Parcubacteria bacterium]
MKRVLTQKFFNRPTLQVAKGLLGKSLIRRARGRTIAVLISEVEAYDGPHDKASHAHRGRTPRNEVVFGEAGRWYVYFTYGMHWMLNIVTGPKGYPAAILIRCAIHEGKPIFGPARLTKYLKIDKRLNGKSANKNSGLWIEDRGVKIKPSQVRRGKRIGVDYAGEWSKKLYNFSLE